MPNSRSGDLRKAGKRQYNPHVLPFHLLSFEHFDGYGVTAPPMASLCSGKGFSTRFRTMIVKTFHKALDCDVRYRVTESGVTFLSPEARRIVTFIQDVAEDGRQ